MRERGERIYEGVIRVDLVGCDSTVPPQRDTIIVHLTDIIEYYWYS